MCVGNNGARGRMEMSTRWALAGITNASARARDSTSGLLMLCVPLLGRERSVSLFATLDYIAHTLIWNCGAAVCYGFGGLMA